MMGARMKKKEGPPHARELFKGKAKGQDSIVLPDPSSPGSWKGPTIIVERSCRAANDPRTLIAEELPWFETEESQHALNRRLFSAIEDCDLDRVKDCIAKGADVNARISIDEGSQPIRPGIMQDLTPLMCAAMLPRLYKEEAALEIARLLLDNGADIDAKSGAGDTAIDFANSMRGSSIVRLLTERSADG